MPLVCRRPESHLHHNHTISLNLLINLCTMTPFYMSRQSENQKSSEKWCFCRSARICSAPVAIRVCRAVLVQVGVVQSSCSRRHRRAVIIVQSSSRSCCRRDVVICRVVVVQSSFLGLGEEGGREGGRGDRLKYSLSVPEVLQAPVTPH